MADRYDGMELDMMTMANMELELEALGVTPAQYAALDGRVQANTDAVGDLDDRVDEAEAEIGQRYTKAETDGLLAGKANRQQEEWITPTLLNGATGTLKYRKNQFGVVEFKGEVTNIPYNEFFLTLPTGYYDTTSQIKVCPACEPAKAQLITMTQYGTVWQYTEGAQLSDRITFDGVSFAID